MDAPLQVPETFPFYRLTGTHRQIGRQFGEACAALIHRHQQRAEGRLRGMQQISRERALAAAARFRPYVVEHATFLDEEVQGVAEGAGISLAEAYLLQLRAELAVPGILDAPVGAQAEVGDECTGFAVLPEATSDGVGLVGQNADLPAFYSEIGVVLEIVPDDQPAVLMLTPAGQVSYIGMNDRGLGIFANFVTCDGWRLGFPRYFLSRLGLTCETVDDAIAAVRSVPRASSRNLIMLDSQGQGQGHAADLETTPTRDARLEPQDGLLAHSNHYVAPALQSEERSTGVPLANSQVRLRRMDEMLAKERGKLHADLMEELLRDRACHPDTICREPGDAQNSDTITFASVIAQPAIGGMRVAVGPPNQHPYQHYSFGGSRQA